MTIILSRTKLMKISLKKLAIRDGFSFLRINTSGIEHLPNLL